jgi:transcriptional regulator with XRE-family HTH domain
MPLLVSIFQVDPFLMHKIVLVLCMIQGREAMTTPIHPTAIRAFREQKRWTQAQLAEATKGKDRVSLPTIKRIEGKKDGAYAANGRKAEALAKALGVSIAELATAPTPQRDQEEVLKKSGYRPLRTMVDAETALAFNMVQHIFGISIKSQIEMAPLFVALLAEGSIAWRRKRVAEIEEAASHLHSLGGGHLSFAFAAYRAADGAVVERQSIAKRDLFAEYVSDEAFDLGFDPSENNPFADYLEDFAKNVATTTVTFDKSLGWKTSEGLPGYRIGAEVIEQLTNGDPDAEYALLRGHFRLKDIPKNLIGEDKNEDRVAWMIARIPEQELAATKPEIASLNLDLDDSLISRASQDPSKGGRDA